MLTLERMGIRTPAIYAAAAQQAERLTDLDTTRGAPALAQFQGVARAPRAAGRAFAPSTRRRPSGSRAISLARVTERRRTLRRRRSRPGSTSGLRPALPAPGTRLDRRRAARGRGRRAPRPARRRRVEWEGQRYQRRSRRRRAAAARRARARQEETTVRDRCSALARLAQTLTRQPLTLDAVRDAATKLTAAADRTGRGRTTPPTERVRALREAAQTLGGDQASRRSVRCPQRVARRCPRSSDVHARRGAAVAGVRVRARRSRGHDPHRRRSVAPPRFRLRPAGPRRTRQGDVERRDRRNAQRAVAPGRDRRSRSISRWRRSRCGGSASTACPSRRC